MKAKRTDLKRPNEVMVKAPKGYHWMNKGGRYFLMEHTGEFVPHTNAAMEMPFKVIRGH
jgi:Ni/Co efflux regulator RcnB